MKADGLPFNEQELHPGDEGPSGLKLAGNFASVASRQTALSVGIEFLAQESDLAVGHQGVSATRVIARKLKASFVTR